MRRLLAIAAVAWVACDCRPARASDGRPKGAWVIGTVRDESGHPVGGANVYAAATFDGTIRTYETAAVATTDGDGRYIITGPLGLDAFSATVVVAKAGLVPAFGWFDLPAARPPTRTEPRPPPPPVPVRDFVVTARGGGLDVVVTADGRPASGATVRLRRAGGGLRQMWAYPTHGQAQVEAAAIAYPEAASGPDGRAHFGLLVPGDYSVTVSGRAFPLPPDGELGHRRQWDEDCTPVGSADAVHVRAGATAVQRVPIYPQPQQVRIRPLDKAGEPHPNQDQQLMVGGVGGGGWMTGCTAGPDGTLSHDIDYMTDRGGPGLYSIELTPTNGGGIGWDTRDAERPRDAAAGWVGVSTLLAVADPCRLTARTIVPATVDVRLLDTAGRPAPGQVSIDRESYQYAATQTVGANGRARFTSVPAGRFHVWAGRLSDGPPFTAGTIPADVAVTAAVVVPPLAVTIGPDEHRRLDLRAVRAGYVRGVLVPPAGTSLDALALYPAVPAYGSARVTMDDRTGVFVAGPYAAGPVRLRVGRRTDPWGGPVLAEINADVVAGRVTRLTDVTPPVPGAEADRAGPQVFVGMGGLWQRGTVPADVRGRVLLPDGRTPAAFARVLFLSGDSDQVAGDGLTDAAGQIHTHGLWATPPSAGSATGGPTVVALVPGVTGGTVVDLAHADGRPLTIVLPAPRAVRGRLTIGGQPPDGLRGRLRVLAGHLNGGRVDDPLSVAATPQPDGTFELPGLTLGDYAVQASVDNIWLSAAVPLHVAADRDPADVVLDVPTPAGPVAVTVVDAAGRPAVGRRVTVDRPAGPLTALLWPDHFTTDGAGVAYVPALEAGQHVVHVGQAAVTVRPPALPCDAAAVVRCVAGD